MRKITEKITGAFIAKKSKSSGNTSTDGISLFLHGNMIAQHRADGLWISNAGWATNTTKERLNALPGVSICQKNFTWFLNGKEWGGEWVKVNA